MQSIGHSANTTATRSKSPRRAAAATAMLAIGLAAAPLTAQLAVGGPRSAIDKGWTNPSSPFPPDFNEYATAAITSGASRYAAEEPAAFLGHGFWFDPETASWQLGKPAFDLPMPEPGPIQSWTIDVTNSLFSSTTTFGLSLEGSFESDLKVIKGAAKHKLDLDYEENLYTNSFSLYWEKIHDVVTPDYVSLALADMSFPVQQIYNYPLEVQAALWEQEIGEYVAVGTRHMASLELKVSISSQASSKSIKAFQELKAKIAVIGSMEAKLETLFKATTQSSDITITANGFGIDVPQTQGLIPGHPDDINEPHEVQDLFNAFLGLLETGAQPRGLVMIPSSAFVYAPFGASPPDYTDYTFGLAREEIEDAVEVIGKLEQWMYPAAKFEFLKMHYLPGESMSIADQLLEIRWAIIEDFSDLWVVVQDHIQNSSDPATTEEAVLDVLAVLIEHRLEADALLVALDDISAVASLNGADDIIISVVSDDHDSPARLDVWFWNVAFFDSPGLDNYEAAIANSVEVLSSTTNQTMTFDNGLLTWIEVLDFAYGEDAGSPKGLIGIKARIRTQVSMNLNDGCWLQITDDLGRVQTLEYYWGDDDNPNPPPYWAAP